MKLTLTRKIIAPYILLGLLVLALFAVMFGFDARLARVADEERALLGVGTAVGAVSSRVQNGILTREETFAIEAASAALGADAFLAERFGAGDARAGRQAPRPRGTLPGLTRTPPLPAGIHPHPSPPPSRGREKTSSGTG